MRAKYSLLNMVVSVGAQLVNIVLLFLSRRIFLMFFTEEYLGVNGLFTEILTVLSLAELGIGTAMMYGLYDAVTKDNKREICQMMNLYRCLYLLVGGAVMAVGLALLPFLRYLIKDNQIPHIPLIYLLYLMDSVLSYFLSYKQTIIQANQKAFVVSATAQGIRCVQILLQITSIILWKNFYLYVAIQIFGQILTNVILAKISERMYPYIRRNREGLPEKEKVQGIYRHIKATAMHKFGGVFVSNTDNLIISAFVGLGSVGLYSNYKMVLNSLRVFFGYIYNAFTASIGNLVAAEGIGRVKSVYDCLNFLMSMLYGWAAVCLYLLFNPFIGTFFGERFLLPQAIVGIIVADFYIHGMRQITLRFRDGMGLYWYDRYKPVFEVMINLAVSLMLVRKYEIAGVISGTIISSVLTNFWIEPYVLFRYGIKEDYKKNLSRYFVRYGGYTLFSFSVGWICSCAGRLIPKNNLLSLILYGIVITGIYGIAVLGVFGRSLEVKLLAGKFMGLLKGRLKG